MKAILQKFCCGSNDPRDHLKSPMRSKHGACACNGHIFVCLSQDDGDYAAAPANLEKSFDSFYAIETTDLISIANLNLPEKVICRVCKGTGHKYVEECDECDGKGEFHHGSHIYECKECDGDGLIDARKTNPAAKQATCGKCEGHGEQWTDMPVGNANFSAIYIRMIAELPNAQIQPNDMAVAKFTFDGGWGALMPIMKRSGR